MRRIALLGVLVAIPVLLMAAPAGACGGLVGENGTIQLTRTSTLAAYHDGVERYVTNFEFTGQGAEVGSIVPLPGVPSDVKRGGDWTLQRLQQEVQPPLPLREFAVASTTGDSAKAQVILETKIDALDITVLKGGSEAVGQWALEHGFLLTPDAPKVLAFYAQRSPIFIPTAEPWVPLRILALGLDSAKVVDADVFLLTDDQPALRAGGTGLELARSDEASADLLADLRSDKGMGWVPEKMWLSYLRVNTAAKNLDYDLAVSTHRGVLPSARMVGIGLPGGPALSSSSPGFPVWQVSAVVGALLAGATALTVRARRRAETTAP
jgi:hypothetical protein